jgi:YVTN family beta-propeller protein
MKIYPIKMKSLALAVFFLSFFVVPSFVNAATSITAANSYYATMVGTKLYVTNNGNSKMVVINTLTNAVINSALDLGFGGTGGAYHSFAVGTKLYVAHPNQNKLAVINTTNDTVSNITLAGGSTSHDFGLVGNRLYVTGGGVSSVLSVINTTTDALISTISLSGAQNIFVVGTKLYVTGGNGVVSVIDSSNSDTVTTITVGANAYAAALVGKLLYVSNEEQSNNDATISVIDTSTDTVIKTITGLGTIAPSLDFENMYLRGSKLYMTHVDGDSTVSVIDTANNDAVTSIAVGSGALGGAISGTKLYVFNLNSDNISVINTLNDTVSSTISGSGLTGPYYGTPSGSKVYVINLSKVFVINTLNDTIMNVTAPVLTSFSSSTTNGNYNAAGTVNITANFGVNLGTGSTMTVTLNTGASVVLSTISTNTLSGTYTVGAGDTAVPDLAVTAITSALVKDSGTTNTNTSYSVPPPPELTGFANGNISDTSNISIKQAYTTITTGTNPYQIANAGNILYVANEGSNNVSVINAATNALVTTISVGTEPYGVAYNSISKEIYVANIASNNVSVIDADPAHTGTTYNTVIATTTVGVRPFYVTSVGTNMYVTNTQSNTVSVIATGSHLVTGTIGVGTAPLGIKAIGTTLYVANSNSTGGYGGADRRGTISVVNTATNLVTGTILVGSGPRGVAPYSTTEVYVSNFSDDTVSVIRTSDNTVTHTITVGDGPRGILTVGTYVYVENFNDGTISVINTANHTAATAIKVGGAPAGMVAVGTDIYLSRFTDSELSIFNTFNNTLITSPAVPGVATSVSATAGNAQTTVTFVDAPSNGSAITGYVVTSSPAGGTDSNSGSTSTSHIVTGLTNGTSYTFTVVASNAQGAGSASSASSPAVVPSTTPILTVQAAASATMTTATLNGNIMDTGGATVTTRGFNYGTTTGYEGNTSATGTFSAGAYTQDVSSLTCGTLYHYRSFAANTSGVGTSIDTTFTTSSCGGGGGHPAPPATYVAASVTNTVTSTGTNIPANTNPAGSNSNTITYNLGTAVLKVGVTSSSVKELQKFLNTLLDTNTKVDGILGKNTLALIKKFQKENKLVADGIIGPKTKAKINGLNIVKGGSLIKVR